MVTMQDCERVWQRFDRLKEETEQYMFPSILVWDLKIIPLYKDLQENWDEHHGEFFMRVMIATLKQFGIDYDPKTEAAHV